MKIKKIMALILSAISGSSPSYDANNDGKIDIVDLVRVKKYISGESI